MKKRIFWIIFTFTLTSNIYSQSESYQLSKELLEISGSGKLGIQVLNQMITMQRQTLPNVPGEFWDEIEKEIQPEDLVDLVIPIYMKYLTTDELKGLIKFYKSPLGETMVEKMPLIMQESMIVGKNWGMIIGQKIVNKLIEAGYIEM